MAFIQATLTSLQSWEWFGIFLARLVVGLLFLLSGYGKLFKAETAAKMLQTLQAAHIPFARFNAVAVSAIEFVCGALVVVGALTPLASLLLAADMLVAIATVNARYIHGSSVREWLSNFLYLPQVLYLVILIWLFFSGPGWFSVDQAFLAASGPGWWSRWALAVRVGGGDGGDAKFA